jgi:hypothetical protein
MKNSKYFNDEYFNTFNSMYKSIDNIKDAHNELIFDRSQLNSKIEHKHNTYYIVREIIYFILFVIVCVILNFYIFN